MNTSTTTELVEKPIIVDIFVGADRAAVWQAIVGDEANRACMFGTILRSTLTVGAPFDYCGPGADGEESTHVYGTVLEVIPEEKLSLLEHPGPGYRENHAELSSRMTWELREITPTVSQIHFVNDQWTPGHPGYADTSVIWPMQLSSLKSFLETGKALDYGW